jgi:hypothetical protein
MASLHYTTSLRNAAAASTDDTPTRLGCAALTGEDPEVFPSGTPGAILLLRGLELSISGSPVDVAGPGNRLPGADTGPGINRGESGGGELGGSGEDGGSGGEGLTAGLRLIGLTGVLRSSPIVSVMCTGHMRQF